MSRRVQIVLVCEDTHHEVCLRRFLLAMGWDTRSMRVEKGPGGRGAADQFVRRQFPRELVAHRTRHVRQVLVVMIDGDRHGVDGRLAQLDAACHADCIETRRPDEHVAVFIPTWNIETWFAYLDGQAVNEADPGYPRLERARDCQQHVDMLAGMCRRGALREPSPPSLGRACDEYRRQLAPR